LYDKVIYRDMTIKNFSPYKIISEAVLALKPNERKVILARFGIDCNRQTLSFVGKKLDLSRERIRQIERDALKKLAKEVVQKNNSYILELTSFFEKKGGIISHEKIAEHFLEEIYHKDKNEFNSLNLVFVLTPQMVKIEKTLELEEGWILAHLSKEDAIKIINDWAFHLQKTNKPQTIDILVDNNPHHKKHKITFLSELPSISKKLVRTKDGMIGLASWPEVNPRNIRDKIYFVLKNSKKPMHFDDIAIEISKQKFDKKGIVKATVHNELIADSRFVLVGRGIYALAEWGYETGTVAEIIRSILRDRKDGLKLDDIIKAVAKQRVVKRNTILINLQTKPEFVKNTNGLYCLKSI